MKKNILLFRVTNSLRSKTKNETLLKLLNEEHILKRKMPQIKSKANGTVITVLLLSFGIILIIWN